MKSLYTVIREIEAKGYSEERAEWLDTLLAVERAIHGMGEEINQSVESYRRGSMMSMAESVHGEVAYSAVSRMHRKYFPTKLMVPTSKAQP